MNAPVSALSGQEIDRPPSHTFQKAYRSERPLWSFLLSQALHLDI